MWNFTGRGRPAFAIEPRAGQESVWDYPRPPVCRPDPRKVEVLYGELKIALSTQTIRVLETASPPTIYIPPSDVNRDVLTKAVGSSFCEWKGQATYWSLSADGQLMKNVGWSYHQPSASFALLDGYLAFYPSLLDCFIDGERVQPQPGGFYGGWVTSEIVGPFKGESGTHGW